MSCAPRGCYVIVRIKVNTSEHRGLKTKNCRRFKVNEIGVRGPVFGIITFGVDSIRPMTKPARPYQNQNGAQSYTVENNMFSKS